MTTPPNDGFILHHYDASPFSEKVRVMFGVKGLAWRSVITPNMLPKPDLVPLTGGYRRAPVMQIGADIYCDSQVILAEIERRSPARTAPAGLAWAVNLWADRLFFQTTVPVVFATIGTAVPKAFYEDREKLSGRPFDIDAMRSMAAPLRGQWRAQAAWIESTLAATGADFLGGDGPDLADVSAYMNIWWLGGAAPDVAADLLAGLEAVQAWSGRMRAVGHGRRTEMAGAEALAVAATAEPGPAPAHDDADPLGLRPGDAVTVSADDYGRDPIAGTLVAAARERVVIARDTPDFGRLHLHFPRVGYLVSRAG